MGLRGRLGPEEKMYAMKSIAGSRRIWTMLLLFASLLAFSQHAWAGNPHVVTVMTRNMDAGTDLNYILGATDQASFALGMAATLAEVKASGIPERAARLADEIAAHRPDLIACNRP